MSDADLGKALRDIKFAERLLPQRRLRQLDALRRTVDDQGSISAEAVAPYRSPQVMSWTGTSTIHQRVARAGKISLVSVYASTVPSTSDAVIEIRVLSEDSPTLSTIATVTVQQNQRFGQSAPMVSVSTGQWIAPLVAPSGSGVFSVSLNITQD